MSRYIPWQRATLGLLCCAALVGGEATRSLAASIGINLREGDGGSRLEQQLQPGDVAGYVNVAQGNWNDVYLLATQGFNLVDSNGSTTAATVNWGASNAWGDGGAQTTTPDGILARGNFDDGDGLDANLGAGFVGAAGDGFGVTLKVNNIPYSQYSVLVYLSSDQGAGGQFGTYTVNGQTAAGGETISFNQYGGWVLGQNVLFFSGFNTPTLDVLGPARQGSTRGTIAGVQIVQGNVQLLDQELRIDVNRNTGQVTLNNNTGSTVSFAGLGILSTLGGLSPADWNSITDNYDQGGSVSNDAWLKLASTPFDLSEATLGTGSIAQGASVDLGAGLWIATPFEDDLTFEYLDASTGQTVAGRVVFTGTGALEDALAVGDLNADGSINAADWVIQRNNFNANLSGMSPAMGYRLGDLNFDGESNLTDLLAFRNAYEAANPGSSFAALVASTGVPEPTALALVAMVPLSLAARRSRRLLSVTLAVSLVAIGASAEAAGIGVSFRGGQADNDANSTGPNVTGVAGVVPQGNWNNVGGNFPDTDHDATVNNLINSAGATTGVSVTWSADETWSSTNAGPAGSADQDRNLVDGYLDSVASQPDVTIDFAGLTYPYYDVYVYVGSDGDDRTGRVRLSGDDASTRWFRTSTSTGAFTTAADYRQATALTEAASVRSNYVKYTDVSGSTLGVIVTRGSSNVGAHGVQIVEANNRLTLSVNTATGQVSIKNSTSVPIDMNYFEITSASSALDQANWSPLGSGTNNGSDWEALGNLGNSLLAQFYLTGDEVLAPGSSLSLGKAYKGSAQDIAFNYYGDQSGERFGVVEYVSTPGQPGDFNADGKVDGKDLLVWQRGFGSTFNSGDFAVWADNFGTSGAAAAVSAVPEPSSALLVLAACGVALSAAKRRTQGGRSMSVSRVAATPVRRGFPVVALAAAALATSASVASAAFTLDRNYKLGEGAGENGAAGIVVGSANSLSPGSTLDEVGPSGAFLDLQVSGGPTYVSVASGTFARPGATGLAANFDGVDDLLRGIPLNRPDELATLVEGYPLNYTGIVRRGMQGYVYPSTAGLSAGTFQSIVFDTVLSGGPAINAAGQWTQVNSQHSSGADGIAAIPATVSVPAGNKWYHFMHHNYLADEGYGARVVPGTGGGREFSSILYIDGIAVSANNDGIPTGGVANYLGTLVVGAREVPNDGLSAAFGDYFRGAVDNLEMYVVGDNTAQGGKNWGQFNLLTDNAWIAARIASTVPGGVLNPGDVNRDGTVNGTGTGPVATDDISAFIAGWRKEKRFQAAHNQITAGDWETWGWGDMNLDGVVNFSDWQILRETHPNGAGLNLAALLSGAAVPEPTTGLLLVAGWALVAGGRSRRSR